MIDYTMEITLRDICSIDWLSSHRPPNKGLLVGISISHDIDVLVESFKLEFDRQIENEIDFDPRLTAYTNNDLDAIFRVFVEEYDLLAQISYNAILDYFYFLYNDECDYTESDNTIWLDVTMSAH